MNEGEGPQRALPDQRRFREEPNWWWDTQRARAVERGEPDPGPLYRDTRYGPEP